MGGLAKEQVHRKAEKIKVEGTVHHCLGLPDDKFLFA
jgi:hypothetical protein